MAAVSRDYKGSERKPASRGGGGSLFIGILIGLVLGLGIALGVAWYINKMPNPFQQKAPVAKPDAAKAVPVEPAKGADKGGKAADAKPRFDFYKILPGVEEPATDQQLRDAKSAPSEWRGAAKCRCADPSWSQQQRPCDRASRSRRPLRSEPDF